MPLIDVHAHLDDKQFSEILDKTIKEAEQAGVTAIINNGIDPGTNRATLDLSKKYKIIKSALGLYPFDALLLDKEILDNEFSFIRKNKPIAIGEVGLDFSRETDKDKQIKIFNDLISLAHEINKPLIIHSRKAEKEVLEILQKQKADKVILHCFNGNKSLIKQAVQSGFNFSIPPIIIRSTHFQKLVELAPIEQLFSETDSPYLGPKQDEINSPKNVKLVIKKISEIKNIKDAEELIYKNYKELFKH